MRSRRRDQIVEKMFRACFEWSCNASAKHLERVLRGLRLIILGRLILLRHLQSFGNHHLKHSNASTYGCASNQESLLIWRAWWGRALLMCAISKIPKKNAANAVDAKVRLTGLARLDPKTANDNCPFSYPSPIVISRKSLKPFVDFSEPLTIDLARVGHAELAVKRDV